MAASLMLCIRVLRSMAEVPDRAVRTVIITGYAAIPLEPHCGPIMCTFRHALHTVVSGLVLISTAVEQMVKQKKTGNVRHAMAESESS